MNAQAVLGKFWSWSWPNQTVEPALAPKKDFPPEAYSYDDPITPMAVASIQAEANKSLDRQTWTVIERLGDGCDK